MKTFSKYNTIYFQHIFAYIHLYCNIFKRSKSFINRHLKCHRVDLPLQLSNSIHNLLSLKNKIIEKYLYSRLI